MTGHFGEGGEMSILACIICENTMDGGVFFLGNVRRRG